MGEQESKQITVLIGGRPYPLKITSSNETLIRRIVRDVNEKVNQVQLEHPNRDKQDCLAMAALAFAVELDKTVQTGKVDPDLPDQLDQLDRMLDQLLHN